MAARSAPLKVDGLKEVLRALNRLPPDASAEIRKASTEIADRVAGDVRGRGDAQAEPLTSSTRAVRDRIPAIRFGAQRRSGLSGGARVNDLMGANFGARNHHAPGGFPAVRRPDYYVYATIKARNAWIFEQWSHAIADACKHVDPRYSDR
jgi:hypothetical protein